MLGTGKPWWIAVTTGTGLLIGALKLVPSLHFPAKPKGLFSEVKDLHVEPKEAPAVALCSVLSLACGASVGPEMALGSLGGGLGTYLAHRRRLGQDETFTSTLTGMAAAMGPLLPTPVRKDTSLRIRACRCCVKCHNPLNLTAFYNLSFSDAI
jgi:H+/Cl- antiporter ClcA